MTGREQLPQAAPADTALARWVARLVTTAGALVRSREGAIAAAVAAFGLACGLLFGGRSSVIIGLPLAAAVLARNVRPDLALPREDGRPAELGDMFVDAIVFCIAAGLLFLPPAIVGALVHRWIGGLLGLV